MAKKKKSIIRKTNSTDKMQDRNIKIIGAGLIVVFCALLVIWNPFNWSLTASELSASVSEEAGYTQLNITDYATGLEIDEANWYVYGIDTSELTDEAIEALTFNDMALEKTLDSGDKFTPEDDYSYWVLINHAGYYPQYLALIDGYQEVKIMNTTDNVGFVAYDAVTLNNTIVNSTALKWKCIAQAYTDDLEIDYKQGFLPYYNASLEKNINLVLTLDMNTTVDADIVKIEDNYSKLTVVSDKIYIEFNEVLFVDSFEFEWAFKSGVLGVTADIDDMSFGYGYAGASTVTNWVSDLT